MFLSVITPTYNRMHTLQTCYLSLINQTDKDFEWIVVDDGSTDDTEGLIHRFLTEGIINIKYIKQENGGKHRAHNRGVKEASGDLCICLDSDDAFSPDAIEIAKKIWSNREDDSTIGILAKRGNFKDHAPLCTDWPGDLRQTYMMELQEEYNFTGDTALFFKTEVLRENYFKEFDGEKFLPEDSLYVVLDGYGQMILANEVLYYCEYLPDGLTAHYYNLLLKNPMGTAYCYYQKMLKSKSLLNKIKNATISKAFLIQSGRKAEFDCENQKFCYVLGAVGARLYRLIRKMR